MKRRAVLVLADGLRADVAFECMGYLGALRETGRSVCSQFDCDLPGLSRPLYATLLTGASPLEHGIVSNEEVRSCGHTWLHEVQGAGGRVAAVAYHWFYELLSGVRFDPVTDRDLLPLNGPLQAARWYFEDDYPDSHCLADAEAIRLAHQPDWMLVHPMGMDHAGHVHGGESIQYRYAARKLDSLLSRCIPRWHGSGYDVILASDHGMGPDRMHGGRLPCERAVPFMWIPARPDHDAGVLRDLPTNSGAVSDFVRRLMGHDQVNC